jgi:hypothetical protein
MTSHPIRNHYDEAEAARELSHVRQRTLDAIDRCLALLVELAAEDWRRCGKAACARSRRCRGFACEPKME